MEKEWTDIKAAKKHKTEDGYQGPIREGNREFLLGGYRASVLQDENVWDMQYNWRRKWQPTPVFLPGKSPWAEEPGRLQSTGRKELDTAEHPRTN